VLENLAIQFRKDIQIPQVCFIGFCLFML
jgi:hypothetical protein